MYIWFAPPPEIHLFLHVVGDENNLLGFLGLPGNYWEGPKHDFQKVILTYDSPKPLYLLGFPSFPDLSQPQTIVFACFPSFSWFFQCLMGICLGLLKASEKAGKAGKASKYNGLEL